MAGARHNLAQTKQQHAAASFEGPFFPLLGPSFKGRLSTESRPKIGEQIGGDHWDTGSR
ncbi:protein of unknown function [Magnetospirillum sp. XM-1]|nr:protein of unknown function [Magnetospirillum sp. XM-1]